MININLLDWRSKRIKVNNNIFFVTVGAVSLASIIISSVAIMLFVSIGGNKEGNITYLDAQIKEVESKIIKIKGLQQQKELLLSRRKIIEDLQSSRSIPVKIFDNLAKAIPDGVVLTSLARTGDDLTIIGDSNSNSNISLFMKNIQQLKWVKTAELNEIKAATASKKSDSQSSADENKADDNDIDKINFELKVNIDKTLNGGISNESK